MNFRT